MKKQLFKIASCCTLLGLLFLSCSIKQIPSAKRTIEITGTGKVLVTPDVATLTLEVVTRDYDIQKAADDNAKRMTNIQNALEDLGIKAVDITTFDFGLNQDRSYQNGKTIFGQYAVTNRINVNIIDTDNVGKVIDTAIKNGATGLQGLKFSCSKEQEAAKQARIMAIQNALDTASLMANTQGVTLGKVLSIKEKTSPAVYASVANYRDKEALDAIGTPVSSGKKDITVSLLVEYEMIK